MKIRDPCLEVVRKECGSNDDARKILQLYLLLSTKKKILQRPSKASSNRPKGVFVSRPTGPIASLFVFFPRCGVWEQGEKKTGTTYGRKT
jgi:hypothetical protein